MSSFTEHARPRRARSFVRRLLADSRGTATTETVIMLPLFAIVWGAIMFAFSLFQRTIQMHSMTRAHVWAFAYVGCPDGSSAPDTALDTATAASQLGSGGLPSIVADVIGAILEIKWGHGTRHGTTVRPNVLGGGSVSHTDELWVICNTIPRTNGDYFTNFVSSLFAS